MKTSRHLLPLFFLAAVSVFLLSAGCSAFVPAYDNPISKQNVKAKEKRQEQERKLERLKEK